MTVRIVYCGHKIVPRIDLSDVKLALVYTGHNQELFGEKNIPYLNTYILHEPMYDREERTERLAETIKMVKDIQSGTILVHCEFGQTRSRELAEVLSEKFGFDLGCFYKNNMDEIVYEEVPHTGDSTMHEVFKIMISNIESQKAIA